MSWPLSMWGALLRHDGAAAWSWGFAGSNHCVGSVLWVFFLDSGWRIGVSVGRGSGVAGLVEGKERACLS